MTVGRLYRVTRGAFAGRFVRVVEITAGSVVVRDSRSRARLAFSKRELEPFDEIGRRP